MVEHADIAGNLARDLRALYPEDGINFPEEIPRFVINRDVWNPQSVLITRRTLSGTADKTESKP